MPAAEKTMDAPAATFEPDGLRDLLLQAEPWLRGLEDPHLRAYFAFDQQHGLSTRITAAANGFKATAIGVRVEGPLLAEADLLWSQQHTSLAAHLRGHKLHYRELGEISAPVVSFQGSASQPAHFLQNTARAMLTAETVFTPMENLQYPVLRWALSAEQPADFTLSGLIREGAILASGRLCTQTGVEIDEIRGELLYSKLKQSPYFPSGHRFVGGLAFEHPIHFRATFPAGFSIDPLPPVQLFAMTDRLDLAGLTGVRGEGEIYFDPAAQILQAIYFRLDKETHALEGSYWQDLQRGLFAIQLEGGFMPMEINRWMTSWWEELWSRMAIRALPEVNLQILGNWQDQHDRFVFGNIRVTDFGLFGLDLERATTRLRFERGFLELYNFEAERPEGRFSGSFGFTRDPRLDQELGRHFSLHSTINPAAAQSIFGPEVEGIISQFTFSLPPTLDIQGVVYSPYARAHGWQDDLQVTGEALDPLTFRNIALDHLSFTSRYADGHIHVSPLEFGLGGGSGEGEVEHRTAEDTAGELRMRLNLRDAEPGKVAEALPWLDESTRKRFAGGEENGGASSHLHFDLNFSGQPEVPETHLGSGWISVQTPQLANVELLGDLSRLINTLPLPFRVASFSFRELESNFSLEGPQLHFPDIRINSPTSRVLASGKYDLAERQIEFDGRLFFLGETSGTLLAPLGFIMSPLGHAFEFRLHGDVDNPSWRVRLDPRNILQGVP